jgi:hypothetical protein
MAAVAVAVAAAATDNQLMATEEATVFNQTRLATVFALAASAVAVALAPVAQARPECTQTGPNTTLCTTNGSSSITTSPPPMQGPNYGGWPLIGFGGFGLRW